MKAMWVMLGILAAVIVIGFARDAHADDSYRPREGHIASIDCFCYPHTPTRRTGRAWLALRIDFNGKATLVANITNDATTRRTRNRTSVYRQNP